ncbi:two-component system sensor histidine kinase NtrB [Tumebacillus permanentifrigoris]|uniref:histidine kinase n=1 Tax=Tumebacillus permanentifrigoris TaxID=378543 RepID=A0A316DPW0_9BACL|nr:ATP-binding protein [Tumebacillus permanentifrigoris]PWK05149.1 nitrogen-specific signal transduction histidine kinase [Tumebacillus permanentifrigoris]
MKQSSASGEQGLQIEGLAIEAYRDGVVALDFEMRVVGANRAAMELLCGEDRELVLPCDLESFVLPVEQEYDWLQDMVRERICYRNHIVRWSRQGKERTLLADSYFTRGSEGEPVGLVLFLKDIGNLVSLERQVHHHEKLATVGKIAAGVAHEIRNPLTSIKGFLQMMRHGLEQNGLQKEHSYTTVMLSEIERVNQLVGELLLLSKPRELRMEHLEMEELITVIAPLISSEAILHNIEFDMQLEPTPLVYADREMLKQVLWNLVKNAIEAMATETNGGKLTIRSTWQEREGLVRVEIKDSGPGIPHYLLDRIFDTFFTTKETGTGLGLPICQRIINDLGGKLQVTSKGFGTTVSVLMPGVKI